MSTHFFMVFSDPADGREAEYNHDRHVEDMLKLPGFCAAQRFRKHDFGRSRAEHQYLTPYELTAEPEEAIGGLRQALTEGRLEKEDPTCVAPKMTSRIHAAVTKRFTRVDA
jgi:propanediol dehydratase small subunit